MIGMMIETTIASRRLDSLGLAVYDSPHAKESRSGVTPITTLEQALARIAALEKQVDHAIDVVCKRTDELEKVERKLMDYQIRDAEKQAGL